MTLVGQGALDIGLADGTSVIPAVGQGIPIKFAATIYAKFPERRDGARERSDQNGS